MDLSAEEVYRRFQNGLVWRAYWSACDAILGLNTTYVRHPFGEDAWLFFQHLSATMVSLALQDIAASRKWPDNLCLAGLIELVVALHTAGMPDDLDNRYVSPIDQSILDSIPFDA